MSPISLRLWPLLLVAVAACALAACDSASDATTDTATAASLAADAAYYRAGSLDPADSLTARLTRGLSLSDAQIALVSAETATVEPGDLWRIAAALTPTLTGAQRLVLDSIAVSGSGHGPRGVRTHGGGRDSTCAGSDSTHTHADSTRFAIDWATIRAQETAARDAALGLSESESAALDAAIAALRTSGTRTAANVVPESVAALLSDAQQQVYLVHQELRAYLRLGHGHRGGRGGGPRGGGRA